MEQTNVLEQTGPPDKAPDVSVESEGGYVFNVTAIYQDLATREWAAAVCDRLKQLAGSGNIRAASWEMSDLTQPEILVDAVHSAARADIIVIAVAAADDLHMDVRAWIDNWLPLRSHGGALMALMGLTGEQDHQAPGTREYLHDVAHRSGLAFLPQERILPVTPSDPVDLDTFAGIPGDSPPEFTETATDNHNHEGYIHWGLNE